MVNTKIKMCIIAIVFLGNEHISSCDIRTWLLNHYDSEIVPTLIEIEKMISELNKQESE